MLAFLKLGNGNVARVGRQKRVQHTSSLLNPSM